VRLELPHDRIDVTVASVKQGDALIRALGLDGAVELALVRRSNGSFAA